MGEAAIEAINRLSADQIARRLSGPRTEIAAFVREAAQAGSAEARARFAQMLLDGDGIEKDEAAALLWFERAARAGHLEAANMVGRCHDLGWGTPIHKSTAAAWYKRAAERGLIWAKYNYATLLALGQGVPQDRVLALSLFREAAEGGDFRFRSQNGSMAWRATGALCLCRRKHDLRLIRIRGRDRH